MFKMKKGSGDEHEGDASSSTLETDRDPQPVAAPPPRRLPPTAAPLPTGGFHPDVPRRPQETPLPTRRVDRQPVAGADARHMLIGRDVRLSGDVGPCDTLAVDGEVDMTLRETRVLQVGPSGVFRGTAEVVEGDIFGRFDGNLTVKERLTIRSTGRVTGRIRYGKIVVESGGVLSGEIATLVGDDTEGTDRPVAPVPASPMTSMPQPPTLTIAQPNDDV